jgi:hypothetical protein
VRLRRRVVKPIYDAWLAGLMYDRMQGLELTLLAPDQVAVEYIKRNYVWVITQEWLAAGGDVNTTIRLTSASPSDAQETTPRK